MNEPLPKTNAGGAGGKPPAAPVGATPAAGAPEQPARPVVPAKSATDFGGNPTGRDGGKFKFPVNSPEGQKERREADAERKRLRREASARLVEPPPLPSAGARTPGELPPPAGSVSPGASAPLAPPSDAIPWTPELIKDISDELINAAEEGRQNKLATLATDGGLPEKAVKRIHTDAAYKPAAKKGLQLAIPKLTARVMNRTGISSEHSDSLVLATALVMIWKQGRALKADVLELIEENNKAKEASKPANLTQLTP